MPAADLLLDACENANRFKADADASMCSASTVEGHRGAAVSLQFKANSSQCYVRLNLPRRAGMNETAGIAFDFKGDGSDGVAGLSLAPGRDHRSNYSACVPLADKRWHRVVIPWQAFSPEDGQGPPIGSASGRRPATFRQLWFGKRYYYRRFPEHSFSIDNIALVPSIDLPPIPTPPARLQRLHRLIEEKEPITILALGDSLTDARHGANRKGSWLTLVQDELVKSTGNEHITVVNRALGGNQLHHGRILMPRDFAPSDPHLVTVLYGYNDWADGVRQRHFHRTLCDLIDDIRRMSGGSADILLITTPPALDVWDELKELADAVRQVADEKGTGLADLDHALRAVPEDERSSFYLDGVHFSPRGHRLCAQTVLNAIQATSPRQ